MSSATPRSSALTVPPSQNTAPVFEFRCLFSHDVRRKSSKRWHDGFLRFHTFNRRVMLYDEVRNFIGDTHLSEGGEVQEGDELSLNGAVLVEVSEPVGTIQTDLAPLFQKKPKAQQNSSVQSPGQPVPRSARKPVPTNPSQSRHKPLSSVLGTPRGPYGKASLPSVSPFEARMNKENVPEDERAAKRQKTDTPQLGWSITRTSKVPAPRNAPLPKAHAPVQQGAARNRHQTSSRKPQTLAQQGLLKVKEVIELSSGSDDSSSEEDELPESSPVPRQAANTTATNERRLLSRQERDVTPVPLAQVPPAPPQPRINREPAPPRATSYPQKALLHQKEKPEAGRTPPNPKTSLPSVAKEATVSTSDALNHIARPGYHPGKAQSAMITQNEHGRPPNPVGKPEVLPQPKGLRESPKRAELDWLGIGEDTPAPEPPKMKTLKVNTGRNRRTLLCQSLGATRRQVRQKSPPTRADARIEQLPQPMGPSNAEPIVGAGESSRQGAAQNPTAYTKPALPTLRKSNSDVAPLIPNDTAFIDDDDDTFQTLIAQEDAREATARTINPVRSRPFARVQSDQTAPVAGHIGDLSRPRPAKRQLQRSRSMMESTINVITKPAVLFRAALPPQPPSPLPVEDEDVGPWSTEAFDLMDWRPPDRDKSGKKIEGVG